jgi:hypothetical protein
MDYDPISDRDSVNDGKIAIYSNTVRINKMLIEFAIKKIRWRNFNIEGTKFIFFAGNE